MMKRTVYMILCLLLTTPYIGGELGNERTENETVIADAHSMVRKSISASKKAKISKLQQEIALRQQRLFIEGDFRHMPKSQWCLDEGKLRSLLPIELSVMQTSRSLMAHFCRKTLWNSGLSKSATKKIVKKWFPTNSSIKRLAKNQGVTRGEYAFDVFVRQKALHLYLTTVAHFPVLADLDEYIANNQVIYQRSLRTLAKIGGYNPEDILRAEVDYKTDIDNLTTKNANLRKKLYNQETADKVQSRLWTFASVFYSKKQIKSLQELSEHAAYAFNDIAAPSLTMNVSEEHASLLLGIIPSLKPKSVKTWVGKPASTVLRKVHDAAEKQLKILQDDLNTVWKKDYQLAADKAIESRETEWTAIKTRHAHSRNLKLYQAIQQQESKLDHLEALRSTTHSDLDSQLLIEGAPWMNFDLSDKLVMGQYINNKLSTSAELSLFCHPNFIPEYFSWEKDGPEECNITPSSLHDVMGAELLEDTPYISLPRKHKFAKSDNDANIKEWTINYGLSTTKHYREMTTKQLHTQHMETPIMLSLPEGVLKTLGTHFNRVFKEGAFYTGHWTGEVYDFFAPTPKQFEKEQTDAKVEDILSLYAF
ncbi:hypothetical protein N9X64_00075 [bacterium]|nr:hypothetical protein [bacterium]